MLSIKIDCVNISSIKEIREKIADSLHFPHYYGRNWDAWEECMTDLDWIKDSIINIELLNFDHRKYKPEYQTNNFGDSFEVSSSKFFISVIENIQDYWDTHSIDNDGNEKRVSIVIL